MISRADSVMNWRNRTKLKLIEYKGGKCCKCGYSKPIYNAYDFHHRDPNIKDFSISGKSWSYEKLKLEVDKCDLVCKNCHAEIHFCLTEEKRALRLKLKRKLLENKICLGCGKSFKPTKISQKNCNEKCVIKKHKYVHPSKEVLEKLLWEKTTVQIAKEFGVSDKAIEKLAKKYNLKKPTRGYWQKIDKR
jgi:hypothetical protein